MENYIVEYEIHWSDGCVDYEKTVNVTANSLDEAKRLGLQEIDEEIEGYNRTCSGNYYRFIRCVKEEDFSYMSSAKEDTGIYQNAGHIDVLKFNPFR